MADHRPYFFCGIGGSGMLPLAMIVKANGHPISGSDRALDQGRLTEKFDYLRARGATLFPQDGSGVTPDTIVVASTAVEATIPDVKAAQDKGATLMTRAELLAQLFNAAKTSVGVAGTSGKSTTTGMIGWVLHETGRDPTVMNGAVMKNFASGDAPFASALVGQSGIFVSEVDESDGSIARYTPRIAVLNNISLDHKSMDELRVLFRDFLAKADTAVINRDDVETAVLAAQIPAEKVHSFSLRDADADLVASAITPAPDGIAFDVHERKTGASVHVHLRVPGRHNISNALAALAVARAVGVPLADAAKALEQFGGVKRRLETVGTANGITVIDDFGHNPDKIAATLNTLHDFPGRLLVMFQPHGYGPLAKMRAEFIQVFVTHLREADTLLMPEPVYFGGTVDRSVSSADIAEGIRAGSRTAQALPDRAACGVELVAIAKPGDRIVVMGARDDTLSHFAAELLEKIAAR
ncbi:MAG TPA: Mur ligase family protein [Rhizomicrobium sp.]|nr:Mur ligase family protein [Rhizomicrobium sp.]